MCAAAELDNILAVLGMVAVQWQEIRRKLVDLDTHIVADHVRPDQNLAQGLAEGV